MSRLRLLSRCAALLLPLLLLWAGVVQAAHFANHLAHPHSAAYHYDNADDDWDGHCTLCRHINATTTPGTAPAFLPVATPVVIFRLPGYLIHCASFTAQAYPPLAARPPPALA